MHKDASFTIETIRKMLEQNSVKSVAGGGSSDGMNGPMSIGGSDEHASALVREALDKDVNLIPFLTSILEGTVEGGDKVGSEVCVFIYFTFSLCMYDVCSAVTDYFVVLCFFLFLVSLRT